MTEIPFKLVVRAVIKNQDGKILILKRSRDSRSNPCCWELPGGKVEPEEDFDKALIREIKEETNLNIVLKKAAGIAQQDLPYSHSIHVIMNVKVISGDLKISHEHEEYQWAFLDEIKTLKLSEWFYELIKEKEI
ncbi:NUDIX hydrolase [Methanobacterium alcaliphilum]|uniref:NUDIX hydrolase n=1 Tax=Methanobacterium alcaliphilum TaxID=392018 RepID=UPI00200B36FE|nr:NUDIX domain-containing protein [Methanobacterium alcaliphilum]MCK9151034.1 NUDIX domain-containing protein [Methanobacterium alcaliphilum]